MRLRRGMTYIELLTVVAVLGCLATFVVPQLTARSEHALADATVRSLSEIRMVIVGAYANDFFGELPGPLDPDRAAYPQLAYLYVNPQNYNPMQIGDEQWSYNPHSKRGWSGPYLTTIGTGGVYSLDASKNQTIYYGEIGDPAPLDGWGNPIVLQQPVPSEIGSGWSRTDRRYARLVSAGPDGVIDTPPTVYSPTLEQTGDDLVLFLSQP